AIQLEAITAAGAAGLKDHDRWLTARTLLARKLDGRRSTSRLPALLDYVLTRPIVSAGMIAKELRITPRAAQDLVAELGLREATG
ncbi:helix-turn-helix domain-containing protein, partial [Idiomarina sp. ST10R2A5]